MSVKKAYDELISNWKQYHNGREFTVPDWHERYTNFFYEVARMRHRMENGYELDAARDADFLKSLIYTPKGDISNAGRSALDSGEYQNTVGNPRFMNALSALLQEVNLQNLQNLDTEWTGVKVEKKPLLIKRIYAACTTTVSSTVAQARFYDAIEVFKGWGFAEAYRQGYADDYQQWIQDNKNLMSWLKDTFKNELATGETDIFKLSVFVWEVHINNDNLP